MFGLPIRPLAKAVSVSVASSCQCRGGEDGCCCILFSFFVSPGSKTVFLTTGLSPDMTFTWINNETGHLKAPVSCSR